MSYRQEIIESLSDKFTGEWGKECLDKKGVKVLRTTNFTNEGKINYSNVVVREIENNIIEKKKLLYGDIIIEKSGGSPDQPVGRVVFFDREDNEVYLCNNFTAILRANKQVYHKFLFYSLFYNHMIGKTLKYQNKTTGIINLKLENYLNEKILIPELNQQKRIVAILDKADALRQKRKQALALLDELLRSTFWEMFGDPVSNPKKWELKKFGKIFNSIRYGTGSPPPYIDSGIPFIRATNIKGGTIVENEMKFISEKSGRDIEKCRVKAGDLILVRSGINSGDCALINKQYDDTFAGYDLIIDIDYPHGIFYNFLINTNYGKAVLKPLSRRAGQPHLNAEQISNLIFYFPPIELQTQFAKIVEQTAATKVRMQQSLQELENQFQALMQRAFKGEL